LETADEQGVPAEREAPTDKRTGKSKY